MTRSTSATFRRIVVLTGAGISAESGIATFRDKDGLWARHDISEVATPEAFARNPAKVQAFYNQRRRDVAGAQPNTAHAALARLEQAWLQRGGDHNVLVVTQNVDPLHERAGTQNLIHMHGELLSAWCIRCDGKYAWHDDLSATTSCPGCSATGGMRPDIVWFSEMPYHMERIGEALARADLFIAIGTSGNVHPASGFVEEARHAGAHTVELNLEPSLEASLFQERRHGPAGVLVPNYVDVLAAGA